MKIKISLILSLLLLSTNLVHAATATPSATPTTDQTIDNNLKTRVKEIIQEKLSSSEAEIKQKVGQYTLVGYVGQITSVTSTNLTLESGNETFQVTTDTTTDIINNSEKVKLTSLAIGSRLLVIGSLNSKKDLISAKRIVVTKEQNTAKAEVYLGTITTLNSKTRTLTLKTDKADINLLLAKKANLAIDELKEGQKLIVIVYPQKEDKVVFKAKIL